MTAADWLLVCGNAVLVTLLLRASAAKLVSPGVTSAALSEIFPRGPQGTAMVRVVAVLEVVAVFAVVAPALRMLAQVVVGLLGAAFLLLGVLGKVLGSNEPCGCFGANSARPLGTVNIMMGLLVLGLAGLNIWAPPPAAPSDVAVFTSLFAVIGSVGWLFWNARDRVRVVVANVRVEKG